MNIDLGLIEKIFIFFGLIFVIIAYFKPKNDNQQFEEKVERLLEDFITQVDLENEEILRKIKQMQSETPVHIDERLTKIEQSLSQLEQNKQVEHKEQSDSKPTIINPKHEEIINLFQNGDDIDTIAKKMQMGHAEITLILDLSKKGFNYA